MARKTKDTIQNSDSDVELTRSNALLSEDAESSEYGSHSRSRCGGALRLSRENQGLTIQEIASRLRLSAKQIEAIEADNFALLPEPTIVRGFIRNYAKQLKINAEPLLDAYNVIVPSAELHELAVKPSANMKMTSYKKPNTGRNLLLGLLALAGLGTWLFYQNYVEKPSPTAPSATVESVEPLPEAALPAAERAVDLQASTELALPPADANAAPPPVSDATAAASIANAQPMPATVTVTPTAVSPAVAPSAAPPAVVTLPAEPTVAPTPNGMAKVEFSANQETWINVIDANGREIFSKIIFAGSRESIEVKPPVNVTVGNAGATSMSLNGKSIDLAPHSRNNVAHIKLD
jgi:cytoskeleton protein RodZ